MRNEGLMKNFNAGAAINPHRIVKFGTSNTEVVQGAAATDALIGVSDSLGADAAGEPTDVIITGIAEVEYGGTVTRGDLLTADANGMAVVPAPAAGANNRIIGIAAVSGVSGDIGSVILAPGSVQG